MLLLAIGLFCALGAAYIAIKFETIPRGLPPLADGYVPYLGHLISWIRDCVRFLRANAQKYHGAFTIKLGNRNIIMLTNPEVYKEMTKAPEEVLSYYLALDDTGFSKSLGPKAENKPRKFSSKSVKVYVAGKLLSNMDSFSQSIADHVKQEFKRCMAMECPSGVTKTHINIEPFVFFRRVMFHSMISFLFGRDSKAHDPSILRKWEESSNLFRRAIQVSMLLPSFASQVHFARAARSRSELMTLLKPAICEQLNTKDDENFVKNALKYYTGSGTEVSEEELAEIAVKVIGLGTNGPTAVVANTLLELSKEKNAAFLDELVAECKPDPSQGFFSQSYLDSLKHLSSCIGETLRVTCHPVGTLRKVVAPWSFEVNGTVHVIPPGCFVASSHIVEAMDPQRFECPEEWRPHRFLLNDDSHLISKFTPFSHGLHKCPGQKVSMTMMRLAIRSFLSLCKPSPSEIPIPGFKFSGFSMAVRKGSCLLTVSLKQKLH